MPSFASRSGSTARREGTHWPISSLRLSAGFVPPWYVAVLLVCGGASGCASAGEPLVEPEPTPVTVVDSVSAPAPETPVAASAEHPFRVRSVGSIPPRPPAPPVVVMDSALNSARAAAATTPAEVVAAPEEPEAAPTDEEGTGRRLGRCPTVAPCLGCAPSRRSDRSPTRGACRGSSRNQPSGDGR